MRRRWGLLWTIVLGACLPLIETRTAIAEGGFVVLVNRTNPVSSLRRSELKQSVLGGAKQWDNGAVVQMGIIPGNAPETVYLASPPRRVGRKALHTHSRRGL